MHPPMMPLLQMRQAHMLTAKKTLPYLSAGKTNNMNVMHSCRNDDWKTPVDILRRCRMVLGDIDLDPASDDDANQRVQSSRFITKEEDGLTTRWTSVSPVTVFVNPPGGKLGNRSMTALFWRQLMYYLSQDLIKHAIFLCFSAEALQNTQGKDCKSVMQFPFCVPAKRIRFDYNGPFTKSAPSHSNVIVYVPGLVDKTDKFIGQFRSLGDIKL